MTMKRFGITPFEIKTILLSLKSDKYSIICLPHEHIVINL